MNRYKLQSGPDGIVWCSLNPLEADLREQLDNATDEHTRTNLYAVLTFVQALIIESKHNEMLASRKETLQ